MNYRNSFIIAMLAITPFFNTALADTGGYGVVAEISAEENNMGVKVGDQIITEFMLDPGITPTLSLSTRENLVFIDPWRWHWRLWDWLRGFIILIPRLPIPGPDPVIFQIRAVFDDSQDMIMDMPGVPPLERGSAFVTEIFVPSDSEFLKEGRLPNIDEINGSLGGTFKVEDPQGAILLRGKVETLKATPSEPACKGDLDGDTDVDISDVRALRLEFGRKNCPLM